MSIFTRLLLIGVFGALSLTWIQGSNLSADHLDPEKITCITLSPAQIRLDTCEAGLGRIALVHDGTSPFTYEWAHDSTLNDSIATGLVTGPYQVTVTDANGCTDTRTYIVGSAPNPLQVPITTVPDTCGAGNGSASIDVAGISGGEPPYTFVWDSAAGGGTAPTLNNLFAGEYTVIVSDDRGCTREVTAVVAEETNGFDVDLEAEDVLCFGESTGEATAIVTGGNVGQYTFEWSRPGDTAVLGTSATLSGIPAGVYRVRVFDPIGGRTGGCSFNGIINVNQPDTFEVGVDITPTVGCTTDDGLAVALPRGGVAPYQYAWTQGGGTTVVSTNDSLIDAAADLYRITLTDTNGCVAFTDFAITSEPGPFFSTQILQQDDCGKGEGIARVAIEQGTAPYRVVWWTQPGQPSDTSLFAYNLQRTAPGSPYTVTVIGADSCLQQAEFVMPGNDSLSIRVTNREDDYCERRNGQITVEVQGGTEPYRYRWSTTPTVTASTITNLSAGTYEVVVLDSFNCDISTEVTLRNELGFTLAVETTDETCQGQEDGEARAVIEGGRAPFTYQWDSNPMQRTPVAANLPGGVYTVQVRDADGCLRQAFGEVGNTNSVEADFAFEPDVNTPVILSEAVFSFTNLSVGANRYQWSFGDDSTSAAINPIHTYRDSGEFFVKLKAFNNDQSCVDSITYGPFIVISDARVWVPNAFSPDGNDRNDHFVIQGQGIQQFDLRIYSRWGRLIFSSNSPDNHWDGSLPDGRPAPTGSYAYVLRTVVQGGEPLEQAGFLLLVR